jgi:hypothetical protein
MTTDLNTKLLSKKITEILPSCNNFEIIQPVNIGQETDTWQNELILFIKPEIFLVNNSENIENSINLVFEKLNQFDAHLNGILILGGKVMDDLEIMNRHYGFINKLSRSASKIISEDDQEKIKEALNLSYLDNHHIFGGHEYLEKFPNENCFDLDRLWFTKKSIKIRSGFYIQTYEKDSKNIILVNGFHPAQLEHYTNPSHRIVLMLIHSNNNWSNLKNEMVGATFPEKAVSQSIRGTLYANPSKFGLEEVNIANNGVHLSAGAFEAMFEIVNFLGDILKIDPKKQQPLILKKMIKQGIDIDRAVNALNNPVVTSDPKEIDLFTATEDKDTDEAISLYKKSLSN